MSKKPKIEKVPTRSEVLQRIKGLPKEQQRSVVCALVGHSLVVTGCFGYIYCARCEQQIADSLAGINANAEIQVRVGHNCSTCRSNYKKLDWRHKLLTPNPFAKQPTTPRGHL